MTVPRASLLDVLSGESSDLPEVTLIGRSGDCVIRIDDARTSRRHAMIRWQAEGFWFFDLGSINGSFINGMRVTTVQLLADGDEIQVSSRTFRFVCGEKAPAGRGGSPTVDATIAEVRSRKVVLFVSDIQGFTAISERLTPDQLAPIIGSWYERTESILNRHGATLDKFIGDCVLAYWLDTSAASRAAALKAAHDMQQACREVSEQHRRILEPLSLGFASGAAVHIGEAAYGSFATRQFTLMGDAVNLAFRLESLTRTLGEPVLASADLFEGWDEGLSSCRSLGSHPVKGRMQPVDVYAVDELRLLG